MLTKSTILKHYKRKDIQKAMVEHAKSKEIGMRYGDGFGRRPDILSYPRDILQLALNGITSLHASEELWRNPLSLGPDVTKKELEELRIAWDLVLDIDCKIFEYSRICADLVVKFLTYNGVQDVSCKFSGNKGFHIGVPFEAFPKHVGSQQTKNLFPDAPKKIAFYVTAHIKNELAKRILAYEQGSISTIKQKVDLPMEEIVYHEKNEMGDLIPKLKVDKFLEIDTILIASRHLYRMPYSLHEKSGLASVPLDPSLVMEFEKVHARTENLLMSPFVFLNRKVQSESAKRLLMQALDFEVKLEEEYEPKRQYEEMHIASPITEDFFPPCIKKILVGMPDGKKRAVFILMNFLGKLGWNKEDIRAFLMEWNKNNPEPLREVYIKGQLANFVAGSRLPPNCATDGYYQALGIACNAPWCSKVKNPVNYTLSKWRRWLQENEGQKEEKTDKDSPQLL